MCALAKQVKIGGSLFKGHQLSVGDSAASYVMHIDTAIARVMNSIILIADDSRAGDYMTIVHNNSTAGTITTVDTLGESLYNPGPGAPLTLPLSALEPFKAGEDLLVTYVTATSGDALTLSAYVEFVR